MPYLCSSCLATMWQTEAVMHQVNTFHLGIDQVDMLYKPCRCPAAYLEPHRGNWKLPSIGPAGDTSGVLGPGLSAARVPQRGMP
eukprot:10104016-Alexandrium_andersonii.AAC.1